MSAYGTIAAGLAGQKVDARTLDAVSRIAQADVEFGTAVVAYEGDEELAYQYLLDKSVLTFSADFIAGNSAIVSVNGLSTTATPFSTNHAAMMTSIAAKVEALTGVSATQATRVLTVISKGSPITLTAAVTSGSTQPTSSQVLSSSATLLGVALRTQNVGGKYVAYDAFPVVREGEIWVMTADTVAANKAAYLVAATGIFTDESSGNVSTNYVFRSSTTGAALARLEVIK